MVYSPSNNETIYDIAVKLYADLVLGLEKILTLNPGLDLGAELFGQEIIYTVEPKRQKPVFVNVERVLNESYSTRFYQSIYDISTQLYGDLTGLAEVLKLQTDLGALVEVGTVFTAPKSQDPRVKYFKERGIIIQTDITPENSNFILMENGSNMLSEEGEFLKLE